MGSQVGFSDDPGTNNACGSSTMGGYFKGVWYTYTPLFSGSATISTCTGTSYDTYLRIFTGTCSGLTCIGFNDDGCGTQSTVTFTATGGTTYYVLLGAFSATTTVTSGYTLTSTCPGAPPVNNECATSTLLVQNATCITTAGTTSNATQSQPACAGTADDDVWYSFIALSSTPTVTLSGSAGFDAVLQVFSGTCGSLTSIACVDITVSGGTETAALSGLSIGQTYYARVHSFGSLTSNQGTFTICVSGPPAPPSNDLCSGAILLACPSTVTGTTVYATNDLVADQCGAGTGTQTAPGLSYKFTGNNSLVTASLCASSYDTRITIFKGTCSSLVCVSGNDDYAPCGLASQTSFNAYTGADYFILVHGFSTASGSFLLTLSCASLCTPTAANDDCAPDFPFTGAAPLNVEPSNSTAYISGNNECATPSAEADISATCGGTFASYFDVWYSFNSGANSSVVIDLSTVGVPSPPVALYTDCGSANYAGYCNTITIGTPLTVSVTPSTSYKLRLYASTNTGVNLGNYGILVKKLPPMTITSIVVTHPTLANVAPGTPNAQILEVQVNTVGGTTPITVSTLRTQVGDMVPTSYSSVSSSRMYYTTANTFSTANLFGTDGGSIGSNPDEFTGSQTLVAGANYFWMTYNVSTNAKCVDLDASLVEFECDDSQGLYDSTFFGTPWSPAGVRHVSSATSLLPVDNTTISCSNHTLSWVRDGGYTGNYDIIIGNGSPATSYNAPVTITGTSITVTLSPGTYTWQVVATGNTWSCEERTIIISADASVCYTAPPNTNCGRR